jgi:hypothetical protein
MVYNKCFLRYNYFILDTTQTQNKRVQISMLWVEFEPKITEFERAKTVHAWDRAATLIAISKAISAINRAADDYKEVLEKDVSLRSRNRLWPNPYTQKKKMYFVPITKNRIKISLIRSTLQVFLVIAVQIRFLTWLHRTKGGLNFRGEILAKSIADQFIFKMAPTWSFLLLLGNFLVFGNAGECMMIKGQATSFSNSKRLRCGLTIRHVGSDYDESELLFVSCLDYTSTLKM